MTDPCPEEDPRYCVGAKVTVHTTLDGDRPGVIREFGHTVDGSLTSYTAGDPRTIAVIDIEGRDEPYYLGAAHWPTMLTLEDP